MTIIGCVPAKKYRINLDADERNTLEAIRDQGTHTSQKYKRATILLLSDESLKEAKPDSEICKIVGVSMRTVERLRKSCHEIGVIQCLDFKPHPPRHDRRKMTGELEAQLIQIACSEAPDGCAVWTTQLVADKAVEMGYVESLSSKSVARLLKKTNLPHGKLNLGVSPRKRVPPS